MEKIIHNIDTKSYIPKKPIFFKFWYMMYYVIPTFLQKFGVGSLIIYEYQSKEWGGAIVVMTFSYSI